MPAMEMGLTAISTLVTLNWAAGVVGVGVGELLLPPPHAAMMNNIMQEKKAAWIECLDTKTLLSIVFSRRSFTYFPGKEENFK